jgi:hypothetical protein
MLRWQNLLGKAWEGCSAPLVRAADGRRHWRARHLRRASMTCVPAQEWIRENDLPVNKLKVESMPVFRMGTTGASPARAAAARLRNT